MVCVATAQRSTVRRAFPSNRMTRLTGDVAIDHEVPGVRGGAGPVVTTKDPPSEHTDRPATDDPVNTASELLGLTVEHPAHDVCVVTVDGELDMFTTPLLEACLCNQLRTTPRHLVVDLQQVCFLSSSGLNCLLSIRESAQTTSTQLHLAGLASRPVARALQVSQLMDRFNTYPTLTDAVTAIID